MKNHLFNKAFSICPITYETITGDQKYSIRGLKLLSPKLRTLNDFPYTAEDQRQQALKLASKLSIQGVQPKLSVKLNIQDNSFDIVDRGGTYILKPQNEFYSELPENEDLSMRLAKIVGIEVPLHGLIYCQDGSLTYFIKRFDRIAKKQKLNVEDFAQLSGETRDTKYNFSMERLIPIIEKFCTFPSLEKKKLFVRTLFNYLIGNEDMHLKNFSLIRHHDKIELAPAYDFLNSTIALKGVIEEIALPLNEKKNNLRKTDLIDYYGNNRLGLNQTVITEVLDQFSKAWDAWNLLIKKSFLSEKAKTDYLRILDKRYHNIIR